MSVITSLQTNYIIKKYIYTVLEVWRNKMPQRTEKLLFVLQQVVIQHSRDVRRDLEQKKNAYYDIWE